MKIISHRGFWTKKEEQNSIYSFKKSIEAGFGIELDVRDCLKNLVISHDMPDGGNISFDEVLKISEINNVQLAINIKSDGMQGDLIKLIKENNINNYFLFDMSVPDAISYYKSGIKNIYSRQSEYEDNPAFYDLCKGVWMDEFCSEWINEDIIRRHLNNDKEICIVSPELHKNKNYLQRWKAYRDMGFQNLISLCTDYPDEAKVFFN